MNKLTGGAEGQGYKELSILPSTYPKGSKILEHLLPAKSGTVSEVTEAAPLLNARELIWRSTHPGDGEGLIGIMPSGQSLGEIEASTAVLAFLDTPEHFKSLGISDRVRHGLCDIFYISEHSSLPRNIGLRGISQKLLLDYNNGDSVRAIQKLFASQVRWIAMPHMAGKNLTITEHPNLDGAFRVDSMGHMQYGDLLHYDTVHFGGAAALDEPIMMMPDGTFLREKNKIVDNPDKLKMLQMIQELMKAVRESGKYPTDVCLQIECGIPKDNPEKAYLFQVREIGPKYPLNTTAGSKIESMYTWQFGPKIDDLDKKEVPYGWNLNSRFGSEGEYANSHITLSSSTLFPVGFPPAYVPIGGISIAFGYAEQASLGHCLTRYLNWAARGGEKGPGTFEQFDYMKRLHEEEEKKRAKRSPAISSNQKQLRNTRVGNTEASIESQLMSALQPSEPNFLDLVQLRHTKPLIPKEPTPQEKALISAHAPLFEEKEILPYEECMKLLDEVFELCNTIPVSYFGDSYGGSQLELHKYTPRKEIITDTIGGRAKNYNRPIFNDEESVRIEFRNSNFYPKVFFKSGKLSLEIDLIQPSMHFSSDNSFILNEGGCMTGTIVYGYCPKDKNGTRNIAYAQHVYGKDCQKTPAYYQYQHPPYRRIGLRESIIRNLFGEPERPSFTGEKYQSHPPGTLQNASDLLGPMLLRMKDALNITLQTDPRTFLGYHALCRTDIKAYLVRAGKK